MTKATKIYLNRLARRAGEQGARSQNQVGVEKSTTGSTKNNRLLKCKQNVRICTFNARTLNSKTKFSELIAVSEKYEIDIICVQEHRLYHPDISIKVHEMGKGWQFATSSAVKAENNSTIGGVGILLSPTAYKSLLNIESIDPRTMIATFNGNPQTSIISCYSPTNTADEDVAKKFYEDLTDLIKLIPKHNVKIVGGDMNAKIGKVDCKVSSFHETTNRNGELLLDLISECEMINLSTYFCKRSGKLWSFTYPNGARAQLDHVLINKKWKNSAIDCQSYNTFSSIQSDHRPVTAIIRLSLRANKVNKHRKCRMTGQN